MTPAMKALLFLLFSLPMLAVVALGIVGGAVMHDPDVCGLGFIAGLLVGMASAIVGAEMLD